MVDELAGVLFEEEAVGVMEVEELLADRLEEVLEEAALDFAVDSTPDDTLELAREVEIEIDVALDDADSEATGREDVLEFDGDVEVDELTADEDEEAVMSATTKTFILQLAPQN